MELLWTLPFEEIKMGCENYISALDVGLASVCMAIEVVLRCLGSYNRFAKLCANYWLEWSKTVDRWARFWLPTPGLRGILHAFCIFLELQAEWDVGSDSTAGAKDDLPYRTGHLVQLESQRRATALSSHGAAPAV